MPPFEPIQIGEDNWPWASLGSDKLVNALLLFGAIAGASGSHLEVVCEPELAGIPTLSLHHTYRPTSAAYGVFAEMVEQAGIRDEWLEILFYRIFGMSRSDAERQLETTAD